MKTLASKFEMQEGKIYNMIAVLSAQIYMKLGTAREDFFIVFLSFWSTILITRYLSFEFYRIFHYFPVLHLFNIPIHHFLLGLIIVAAVLLTRLFTQKFSILHLIFLGVGMGLFADEFWLLATGNFTTNNVYWAGQNLVAIIVLGVSSLFVMRLLEARDKMQKSSSHPYHENPAHPLVTVVVPALNEEKFLENNLTSIVNQKFKNFELIVVDNNSTDRTTEIAKSYGAKVIFNPTVGVGGARQAGFMAAKGEIIATTDADNILPDFWLTRIVSEFKKDKELVAFGGLFQLYSGPITARIAVRYFTYPVFKLDKFFSHNWSLIAQNMAVRKSAFLKVGGFKHVKIGEDADLSQRMASVGKVVLDPTFIVLASGRRARHGAIQGVITYAPNAFSRTFLKAHKFDKLPTVREEQSIMAKLSFIPLLVSVVYLVILFTFMNSTFSDAKQELLSKTNASISQMKLRQIASELSPTASWSDILHAGKRIHIFEEN